MVHDLVTLEVLDGLVRHCLPVLSIWLLLISSPIMKIDVFHSSPPLATVLLSKFLYQCTLNEASDKWVCSFP